jgi:hypothetical protein
MISGMVFNHLKVQVFSQVEFGSPAVGTWSLGKQTSAIFRRMFFYSRIQSNVTSEKLVDFSAIIVL